MPIYFGGTVVLEKAFLSPHQIVGLAKKEKVNALPLVPTIVGLMLKLPHLKRYDFYQIRYITSTGQAFPSQYIRQLSELFPAAKIYSMYGLTECKRVSYLPPSEILKKPTSVGKAMPNVEVYLVGEDGQQIDRPGEVGELVVRGNNVMEGYWNLPEETSKVLRKDALGQKVLYSGDFFKFDEDKYLYFVSQKDILDYCSKNLEKHMLPKSIRFDRELPKTSNGKIDKKLLKSSSCCLV